MNESFNKLFKKSIKINQKKGSIIKGKILDIKNNIVIVDAGLKSESYIPIEQFKNYKGKTNIKINDIVEVSIDNIAGEKGETILSREKAKKIETWKKIEKSYKNSKTIKGYINEKVKGGLTVNINGIKAFLPGSLIDIKPIKNISDLEGKKLKFKIIKLDKKKNNIVISRKAVILKENNYEREKLIKNIYEGIVIKGIIKNITDYGAFIDLGGLDGLLHITDIAWKRVKHPSEILKIGDKIKVKIIKFDKKKIRVSLGLKQLTKDPWKSIDKKYPVNTKIKGKITNITDYGCFIEIEEGIEGLVHISEIDWKNKSINTFKIFKIGEETKAVILNINKEKRRISLGTKQCYLNPWKYFIKKYKEGDIIKGLINKITKNGILIKINNYIKGLVKKSDISWKNKNEEEINKKYKKNEKINIFIIKINYKKKKIYLGIKQLKEDPINKYSNFKKNKILKAKILNIKKNSISLILNNEVNGEIKLNNIIKKKYKKILNKIKINDFIKTKIININKKKRLINLELYINKTSKIIKKKIKKNNQFNTMLEAFKTAKIK